MVEHGLAPVGAVDLRLVAGFVYSREYDGQEGENRDPGRCVEVMGSHDVSRLAKVADEV